MHVKIILPNIHCPEGELSQVVLTLEIGGQLATDVKAGACFPSTDEVNMTAYEMLEKISTIC